MADSSHPSARAKFRFFRDTAKEAVSVLLISLADQRSTRGRLTTPLERKQHETVCASLIREFFRKQKEPQFARLVNGNDIMEKFSLKPSPLVGELLACVEEAQAIGKIKTKNEAFNLIAKKIQQRKA